MKLRQNLIRMQTKELLPQHWDLFYKLQFLTESHTSGKIPSLLIQFPAYIRLKHNRILNDDYVYKPDTDVISPDFQPSLSILSNNLIGTSIHNL